MKLTPAVIRAATFADTSAFYALADKTDRYHSAALRFIESNSSPLVTSHLVVFETITLVRMRLGHPQAVKVGRRLLDPTTTPLIRVLPADERQAWEIFARYRDKRFSFVDCTSFALLTRLKISAAFAFDEDFRRFGGCLVYPPSSELA